MVKSVPVDPFSCLGLGPDILSVFVYIVNAGSRSVEVECKLQTYIGSPSNGLV